MEETGDFLLDESLFQAVANAEVARGRDCTAHREIKGREFLAAAKGAARKCEGCGMHVSSAQERQAKRGPNKEENQGK